ncbi:MAG: hypothetical protein KAJ18_05430 [Candidatus Omnitrophica bacterium]|nr:hypothetical protein [Candidatus Omnitrophota bacterium]
MRNKTAESQSRKDIVLEIVVGEYIKTINPVSSGHIVRAYKIGLSPATVRNILAELEQEGFLTHPHTSAGRVPTQTGYRYYVDHLMHEINLLKEEKARIKAEYEKEVKDLEVILEATSQILSDVTQYTSIISVDGWGDKIFCRGTGFVVEYPETRDLQKIRDILYALEEKERLLKIINRDLDRKIEIYIGHEIASSQIEGCSLAVSRYHFDKGPSGRIAILGPTRMDYQRVVSTLDYVTDLMQNIF